MLCRIISRNTVYTHLKAGDLSMVDISFVIWSTREEESIICEDFMMASRSLVLYDCPSLYLCPASSLIPSSTQDFFFWLVGFKSRIKCLSWDHYELNMAKYARSGLSINMYWILVSCLFMSSTFFHPSLLFVFSLICMCSWRHEPFLLLLQPASIFYLCSFFKI